MKRMNYLFLSLVISLAALSGCITETFHSNFVAQNQKTDIRVPVKLNFLRVHTPPAGIFTDETRWIVDAQAILNGVNARLSECQDSNVNPQSVNVYCARLQSVDCGILRVLNNILSYGTLMLWPCYETRMFEYRLSFYCNEVCMGEERISSVYDAAMSMWWTSPLLDKVEASDELIVTQGDLTYIDGRLTTSLGKLEQQLLIEAIFNYLHSEKYQESIDKCVKNNEANKEQEAKSKEEQTPKEETGVQMSTGTAWFVSKDVIVTCNHVVEDGKTISIESKTGKTLNATVIDSSKEYDLAILKVEEANWAATLPLSVNVEKLASKVSTIGYPLTDILGQNQRYTDGVISSTTGLGGDRKCYQISVPIQPGNSGGALINEKGCVVGVTSSGLNAIAALKYIGTLPQGVYFAVKSRYLVEMLEDAGIEYKKELEKGISPVENLSDATVLIKVR